MKRINILCPGPSLKATSPDPADLTIAVNGAIEYPTNIDWWAAYDRDIFEKFTPRQKEGFILSFKQPLMPPIFRDVKKLYYMDAPRPEDVENGFSVLMALAVAVTLLEGREIRIYGCDMEGIKDYNGNEPKDYKMPGGPRGAGENMRGEEARNEERWNRERKALKRFIEFYESEYQATTTIYGTSTVSRS